MATGILHVESGESFRRTNATMAQVTQAFADLLKAYEATGDHDHGWGPVRAARENLKGDCAACNARRVVQLLGHSV